jgi:uncharacterized membrane protein YbjE (DUF340 family)
MMGQIPRDRSTRASFTWGRALWAVILAGVTFGLICLSEYQVLSNAQIMMLIFLAVPVGAFLVSGWCHDASDEPRP